MPWVGVLEKFISIFEVLGSWRPLPPTTCHYIYMKSTESTFYLTFPMHLNVRYLSTNKAYIELDINGLHVQFIRVYM